MFLLDSNILIYYLRGDKKVFVFLKELNETQFTVSIISRMEVMMGSHLHGISLEQAENYLDNYRNIDLNADIVRESVFLSRNNSKKMKFKDLIIAATAKFHHLTLVTADKDFKKLEGLKTLIYKP